MTQVRISKKAPPGVSLDVDFTISAGVTAIFGPTGAGKTLLLEAIAGFVTPDSGRILLDDAILFDAAARVNLPARRRRCGFVFQSDALLPYLTLRQNLAFAAGGFPAWNAIAGWPSPSTALGLPRPPSCVPSRPPRPHG